MRHFDSCNPCVALFVFDSVPDQGSSLIRLPFDDVVVGSVCCSPSLISFVSTYIHHATRRVLCFRQTVLYLPLELCSTTQVENTRAPTKPHVICMCLHVIVEEFGNWAWCWLFKDSRSRWQEGWDTSSSPGFLTDLWTCISCTDGNTGRQPLLPFDTRMGPAKQIKPPTTSMYIYLMFTLQMWLTGAASPIILVLHHHSTAVNRRTAPRKSNQR